jgi:predicted nucleic acid-binding protein
MKYLIDTDLVIDHLVGDQTASTLLQNTLGPSGIAISIISFAEVYVGILRSATRKQAEAGFRDFLRSVPVLPLTKTVARQNAAIRVDLLQRGRSTRQRAFDLLIAATAIAHQLTLVTRNKADYQDLTGLTLY